MARLQAAERVRRKRSAGKDACVIVLPYTSNPQREMLEFAEN
jgi:hypothetical protein